MQSCLRPLAEDPSAGANKFGTDQIVCVTDYGIPKGSMLAVQGLLHHAEMRFKSRSSQCFCCIHRGCITCMVRHATDCGGPSFCCGFNIVDLQCQKAVPSAVLRTQGLTDK